MPEGFEAMSEIGADNLTRIVFEPGPAAFLAGYLAATASESGTVGAFSGLETPASRSMLASYRKGVERYGTTGGGQKVEVSLLRAVSSAAMRTSRARGGDLLSIGRRGGRDLRGHGNRAPGGGGGGDGLRLPLDRGEGRRLQLPEHCEVFLTSVVRNLPPVVLELVKMAIEDEVGAGIIEPPWPTRGLGSLRSIGRRAGSKA